MITGADTGQAGTDDEHIEMFCCGHRRHASEPVASPMTS
jgi:hypothetical protein